MLGRLTSICSMIVAPSLDTITSPSGETSILSIPFGPSEVFKRFATVLAAIILAYERLERKINVPYVLRVLLSSVSFLDL